MPRARAAAAVTGLVAVAGRVGPPAGRGRRNRRRGKGKELEGERGAADGQKGQRRGVDGKAEWVQIGVARHDGTATCEPNAKPGIK